MRISDITINNFRIYRGKNHIKFDYKADKNIHLVAGKNGFGKTTFFNLFNLGIVWKTNGSSGT